VEQGLSLQQTAQKEVAEEAGLKVHIIGHLGDYHRSTSNTRYYVGKRVGGHPGNTGAHRRGDAGARAWQSQHPLDDPVRLDQNALEE
jgi:8-oxo-dGTP pyrophosphatase MutT (NUDIX family)